MSRRSRGVFDPDYRKAGWSQSKYAPKNSDTSLSQTAAIPCGIMLLLVYGGVPAAWPETRPFLYSIVGLIVGFLGFMVMWGSVASLLRKREFQRLRRLYGLRSEAELTAPDVLERRNSAKVRAASASQFERDVADILSRYTQHRVEVVGGKGDGGIDITITTKEGRLVGIVQCKQHHEKRALSPAHIRELAAVKAQRGVETAYLVTTTRFSDVSKAEAEKYGIKLIDGARLADMKAKQSKIR